MSAAHNHDDTPVEATGVVVPFPENPAKVDMTKAPAKVDMTKASTEVEVVSNRARDMARRIAKPFPSRHRVVDSTKWWAATLLRAAPWVLPALVKEFVPIGRGLKKLGVWWAFWVKAATRHEYARASEGTVKTKHGTAASKASTMRVWETIIIVVVLVGTGVWAYFTHFGYLVAALILVVVALDAAGRANRPATASAPAMPSILTSAVPLHQITKSIIAALEREGFPEDSVTVAEPMRYDPVRHHYDISISTPDLIKPEHVRAIERAIGAKDHSIRNLATSTASARRLLIGIGDPLAGARECEWIPTGSLSFRDPLPLGRSGGETPMEVRFLGVHCGIIGRTRSGKTEGLLWTIIDRFAACGDLVTWGIDLQAGPAFPLWRGVIQKVAYTPEDALELLEAAITEMDRRKVILTALAESDEEEDDDAGTVWTADLGPYLEIIIDEFALAATFNGEKGKVDLLSPFEIIVRTGLKFGVHLVLASQKSGNSDFGSSTMQTQIGLKMLLSCRETDTVTLLGTEARDAGWAPHLLHPAQDENPFDAGKCYISGPAHTTPDIYRADFWPKGSIKRRARERMADGLPTLNGDQTQSGTVDAVEIPLILAAVEAAFAAVGNPEFLATEGLLALLEDDDGVVMAESELGAKMNDAFKAAGVVRDETRKRLPGKKNAARGYWLENIRAAIGGFS